MRLLLDTHIALWAVTGSRHLGDMAERMILEADDIFVSNASLWEISIKHALGKGGMPVSSAQALEAFARAGYRQLDIKAEHVVRVEGLPPIHRDPFDRLLVAQALSEPLTLLTRDPTLGKYSDALIRLV